MISIIKQNIFSNLKNIPGWRTDRKVVIIECDDWGGIRMPTKAAYHKLLSAGISVDKSRYNKYDTLADKEDLERLFEVLCGVKDKNGKAAIMTAVCNVANPDFEKIRQSEFSEYHYEPMTKTLDRYGRHPDTFRLWQEGIKNGIFVPESHGREHITVQLWMQKLREGDKNVRLAFDHEFVSVDTVGIPQPARQFRPEFFYDNNTHREFLEKSIVDGVNLFSILFNYRPTVFVPSNGIFHPDLEKTLVKTGVPFLYTALFDKIYNSNGTTSRKFHTLGQKSKSGLRYYIRNCAFEPTDIDFKGIEYTLSQIKAAFNWSKPAIISTHRVNFIGGISVKNRDTGLHELKKLLNAIIKMWPDVEFMSSSELFKVIGQKS